MKTFVKMFSLIPLPGTAMNMFLIYSVLDSRNFKERVFYVCLLTIWSLLISVAHCISFVFGWFGLMDNGYNALERLFFTLVFVLSGGALVCSVYLLVRAYRQLFKLRIYAKKRHAFVTVTGRYQLQAVLLVACGVYIQHLIGTPEVVFSSCYIFINYLCE